MNVVVNLVDEHLMEFNLPHDALISDLKVAVAKEEGVDDPSNLTGRNYTWMIDLVATKQIVHRTRA